MIAAVDPGREKCGVAVVAMDGIIVRRLVVPTQDLHEEIASILADGKIQVLLCGDGTGSAAQGAILQELTQLHKVQFLIVDEKHTTEEAHKLYWQQQPPQGLRRFLPTTMLTPPVPVDDYVAVLLAWKYLNIPSLYSHYSC
nr:pre-16S rRNA-processing nuclease YqgF [uncultured Anaeromusa sp.]